MATIKRFEELLCWQKARLLTREVHKNIGCCRDYSFKDQIQRASISIMSNIAEGFERGTKQELINYLFIAKGSSGEVRSQLYAALDLGYLNIETFQRLNSLALDCSRLIYNFTIKVKSSSVAGQQYKRSPKPDPTIESIRANYPALYQKFYVKPNEQ